MNRGAKRLAAEAFTSHAGYQHAKNAKVAAQDAEAGARLRAERGAEPGAASDTLFAGVRLWVNGFTEPPAEKLKDIVLEHGGQFFNTHCPAVTHVVTAQISQARDEVLRRSRTVKVVTAAWVVESQRLGRLQEEARFSGLPQEPAQRSVATLLPGSPEQLALARATAQQLRSAYPGLRDAPTSTRHETASDFLDGFFANSRLHHIGSWRQRIGVQVSDGPKPSTDEALERVVMHVDMDCFFVSVMRLERPEFDGLPVVVSHGTATSSSSGEVSSASYEALARGVFKGQRMCDAQAACPNLIVLPYDFAKYKAVSLQVFHALASFSAAMQPMSIDEAYLDVTGLTNEPVQLAATIRNRIRTDTHGCIASVGIGPNKLVAKLATRRAKPDGIFRVRLADVPDFMASLPVSSLVGVGYERAKKLRAMGIETAGQLSAYELSPLKQAFGPLWGSRLQMIAQGMNDSPVQLSDEPQTISVNCNWGVRFRDRREADAFLTELARELAKRMDDDRRAGRLLTLRVMRSLDISREPLKFLGHGECTTHNNSVSFNCATAHAGLMAAEAKRLLTVHKIPPNYIRGLGLAMSDLVLPTPGAHANPGIQPSMAAVLQAAAGAPGSDRSPGARRPGPAPEPVALMSTREYANLSMSQLPQEMLAALGTQVVAELNVGLRSSRSRGASGGRLPVAKPSHPVARQHKTGAKQTRKPTNKVAKGSAPKLSATLPAAAVPAPPPAPLCQPCSVVEVRAALKECVPQLAALPDCDHRLDAAGRLLQAFCISCVTQNDMLSVQRLLRFARSLVAEAPAWHSHCEAAVDASQRAVWERFHTSIQLADPGCCAV